MNYYVTHNEEEAGPFTFEQLRSMWHAGKITSATLYWHEGMTEWESLGSLAEDLDVAAPPPQSARTTRKASRPAPVLRTTAIPETSTSHSGVTAVVIVTLALALGAGGFYLFQKQQKQKATEQAEGFGELSNQLKSIAAEKNLAAIKARKVRVSMTRADVIRSVGNPQGRDRVTNETMRQTAEELWTYENPSVELVYFGYDGRVVYCTAEIDFDRK